MDAVDEVMAILQAAETQEYIGEPISQLAHGLQAANLAAQAGADEELILAALLHDLGHVAAPVGTPSMAGLGILRHERLGADFLRERGFSERTSALVAGHVDAKRYLVARTPGYASRLSDASRQTLEWQGGPMGEEEATRFKASPLFADLLRLRAWDEAAKETDAKVPMLGSYRELMVRNRRTR
jgi:putative nucleotidyltransferase with HDIG domain